MRPKVLILGCGPSGLLAAHAANQSDYSFGIVSKKRKSMLFGSQYLHAPIPEITDGPGHRVEYALEGTPDDYRQKVYGDQKHRVSPETLEEAHLAWDIRSAYDRLWHMYSHFIVDVKIDKSFQNLPRVNSYDLVISTVPRTIWAEPGDTFESTKVWAVGDAPELGQMVPFRPAQDNTVICDGTSDVSWYRLSQVFGYATCEWPGGKKPPVAGVQEVTKPTSCKSSGAPGFYHLGRYGEWKKGVLTSDVYQQTLDILK